MNELKRTLRSNPGMVVFSALTYGSIAMALSLVLVLQGLKRTEAARLGAARVTRVSPSHVALDVVESIAIFGKGSNFGQSTRVTSSHPAVVVTAVRFIDFERLEIDVIVSKGLDVRGLSEGDALPLVIVSPLAGGGDETLRAELGATRKHRPVALELSSFQGQDTVRVERPFVMLGYKPQGHAPWHLEVHNWLTDERFTQETSSAVEHLGIPVEPGDNLLELRLTDATGRTIAKEVTAIYRPARTKALFAAMVDSFTPYVGDPISWSSFAYVPYRDGYDPQPKAANCKRGNGPGSCCNLDGPGGAFINVVSPPPGGEAGDCEGGTDAENGGPSGFDGGGQDYINPPPSSASQNGPGGERQHRGMGAAAANGEGGGVVPQSGQWRSDKITDIGVKGRGLDFNLERRYHSDAATDGILGKGWDFNYGAQIKLDNPATPAVAKFSRGDYRRDTFDEVVEQIGPDGLEYVFTGHATNATFKRVATIPNLGITRMEQCNGFRQEFDRFTGLLKSKKDRYSNSIAVQYDFAGKISTVADTVGNYYSFQYYTGTNQSVPVGRLSKVTGPGGLEVNYEYALTIPGDSTSASLKKVSRKSEAWKDDASGWSSSSSATGNEYEYNSTSGKLEKIKNGKGQTALENVYDQAGNVTSQLV